MSIDAVIAQARRPGSFSERRRFSIARTQAIQKLRQFALADSAAYILELVQSAIGNGAVWIDIHQDSRSMTLAYIGGYLPEAALTHLFDYLFAAKDRTDIGHLRDLAHGVNAMLARDPTRIVVESGDGTLAGTTRLELHAGTDKLDVGRPDHTLTGTFIRAEGLSAGGNERDLVESRCRLAPIPIVFNGEMLFGYAARKIPSLPGYARTVVFDEGDLYGILGHDPGAPHPAVDLMTRGVIIEKVEQQLDGRERLGGVINFDALHKTADHARIVRDDRLAEMWLRVRPYALAVARGEAAARSHQIAMRTWDGAVIDTIPAARQFLFAAGRVVVVPPDTEPGSVEADIAVAIAEALDARIALAVPDMVRALRLLAGSGVAIYAPELTTAVDLEFYTSGPAPLPARPWVVQPVDAPVAPAADLRPLLVAAAHGLEDRANAVLVQLGDAAELRARVYTPAAADDPTTTEVRLVCAGRLLYAASVPSRHAGHVVVAELPDVSPTAMLTVTAGKRLADLLVAAVLVHVDATLDAAASRAIAGLADRDGPLTAIEAHRVQDVLARTAVLQFRRTDGRPRLAFALLEPGPPGVDLLGLPVLPTHAGPPISLRTLADVMTTNAGRVPTRQDDPAPSLRRDAVDRLLRPILGDAALIDLSLPTGEPAANLAAVDSHGRPLPLDVLRAAVAAGRRIAVDHAPIDDATPTGESHDVTAHVGLTPGAWFALADDVVPGFDFDFDEPAFLASAPIRTAEVDGILGVPHAHARHPAIVVLGDRRGRVHRYTELAHDFGVTGVLRLRADAWSPEHTAVVATAVATATGELYDQLLRRLPTLSPTSPEFVRAAAVVLDYAGRRVALVADPHGRVSVRPVQATADRVLSLALFPGRRGLPLTAWHLLRRFAEAGGDPAPALAELETKALHPLLRGWLTAALDPSRITAGEPTAPPARRTPGLLALTPDGAIEPLAELPRDDADLPPDTELDAYPLAMTLEYWLHRLRPDLPPADRPWHLRGRLQLTSAGERISGLAAVTGDAHAWIVTVDPNHWLMRWACATALTDRTPIAWLLLACYARINEQFEDVTNSHEGEFQQSVADALESGALDLVIPRFE